jgi:hypothetical protein
VSLLRYPAAASQRPGTDESPRPVVLLLTAEDSPTVARWEFKIFFPWFTRLAGMARSAAAAGDMVSRSGRVVTSFIGADSSNYHRPLGWWHPRHIDMCSGLALAETVLCA